MNRDARSHHSPLARIHRGNVADLEVARVGGRDGAIRQMQAVIDTVDEVGRVVSDQDIDCDWAKGGTIRLARTKAQLDRQAEAVDHHRALGFGDEVLRALSADEARARLAAITRFSVAPTETKGKT